MKKTIIILACFGLMASCANNETKPAEPTVETTAFDTANNKTLAGNPDYQKGLALVAASDCFQCHKISEAFTGPAYADVAKKYAGQPAMIDSLARTIIKGSTGIWGQAVMTPHPTVSETDAQSMVKYILTLNN